MQPAVVHCYSMFVYLYRQAHVCIPIYYRDYGVGRFLLPENSKLLVLTSLVVGTRLFQLTVDLYVGQ